MKNDERVRPGSDDFVTEGTAQRWFGNPDEDLRKFGIRPTRDWLDVIFSSVRGTAGPINGVGMPPMRNRVRTELIIVSLTARRFAERPPDYLRESTNRSTNMDTNYLFNESS